MNVVDAAYIVLVGDVGSGKSTVVEKVTGVKGRSSDSHLSATRSSECFWVPDGSLIISDTPGANPLSEKMQHNVWIAGSMNFLPVSRIFVVVKAAIRLAETVEGIKRYEEFFENLLNVNFDATGLIVTHMDLVTWRKVDLEKIVQDTFSIDAIVFTGNDTPGRSLLRDILKTCTKKQKLSIEGDDFFKFFKIHKAKIEILKSIAKEVKEFKNIKKNFDDLRRDYYGKDLVDLVFEFQAYMAEMILDAQKRVAAENGFSFCDDATVADEAGHLASMVNQMCAVLYDIRVECLEYQSKQDESGLRRCPYCGEVWTKVEGCDGETTCGERPFAVNDFRDPTYSKLSRFSFRWKRGKLDIAQNGQRNAVEKSARSNTENSRPIGCGKTISWQNMPPVEVPPDFQAARISTRDIKALPPEASEFVGRVTGNINAATRNLKITDPTPTEQTQGDNSSWFASWCCII